LTVTAGKLICVVKGKKVLDTKVYELAAQEADET
jgi:hypothetical protein